MVELPKIKILYVVSTLRSSGPTNQLLETIKHLDKSSFEASILTLSPEPENSMIDLFKKNSIIVNSLSLSRKNFLIKGRKLLKGYIDTLRPDIVHTSGIRADVELTKLTGDFKHCLTVRNFVYEDYVAKFGNFVGKLASKSAIVSMKKCDNVVYCSRSLSEKYKEIISKKPYVIQNGANKEIYSSVNKYEKDRIRTELGVPINKTIFLMVGSLIKRKDPLTVIKAFNQYSLNNKDSLLLILGEGSLKENCRQIANEKVIFKGSVKNVQDYLKSSDFFVSASESEGLPNSVLEAGLTGIETILSDIPEHNEIYENNKGLLNLFTHGDSNELAQKMKSLNVILDNKLERNNEISKYFIENFSSIRMSRDYQDLYKQIITR
ncbi:glycosyltransferase [Shouchella sp. 1P09AA]|uniref:glycosyltransferase n=1 Tax=unclassified Shouchella TaxID=2893065 RepID=UPI0039A0A048